MSPEPDFKSLYQILGVSPEDGWDQVRRAYRRKAQASHPDKAQGIEKIEKIAAARFEQINRAYEELKRYYQIFGVLPPVETGAARKRAGGQPPAPQSAPLTDQPSAGKPTAPEQGSTGRADQPASSHQNRWPARAATILFVVVLAAIWMFPEGIPTDESPPDYQPRELTGDSMARKRDWLSIRPDLDIGELLDLAGPPDHTEGNDWHYGDGAVVVEAGRIAGWRGLPGRADFVPAAQQVPANRSDGFFTLGDSKQKVLEVQGSPMEKTDQQWVYGVSTVQFDNGKVVSWYNSPLSPLRVKLANATDVP